jgi:hypothetical protein
MSTAKYLVIITMTLFVEGCSSVKYCNNDLIQFDKYIYPIDTIETAGFCYLYTNKKEFISIYSQKRINLNGKSFFNVLQRKGTAVYFDSFSFNLSNPNPRVDITPALSTIKDSLIVKSREREGNFIVKKVQGKFIVGITNTIILDGIISHHYKFKKQSLVLVMTPY